MKKLTLILLLCAASAALAQTNAPVVVVQPSAPAPAPTLTELISLLVTAITSVGGFIAAIVAVISKLKLNQKTTALNTIINAVETFKKEEDPQINKDLKAHIKGEAKDDGTAMLVRSEVKKEFPTEDKKP